MWPARQPSLDHRRFVRGVIVHDDMDIETVGDITVDLLEEIEKLGRSMALVAFADNGAGGDIERGEQRGRPVPDIGGGTSLGHAGHHRQDGLLAVERLDLRLLIDAQDERMSWRRKIEADNIPDFIDEQRIARQLEGLRSVRLQAERVPYATDRRVRMAGGRGHRTDRPVRRIGGLRLQRSFNHRRHSIVVDRPRAAGSRLVQQPVDAIVQKPTAPLADHALADPEFGRHLLALQAIGAAQYDTAPLRQRPGHSMAPYLPL